MKKTINRYLSLILVLITVFSVLIACKQTEEPKETKGSEKADSTTEPGTQTSSDVDPVPDDL